MTGYDTTERVPGPGGAWVAAIIVVAISLLSTFTLSSPEDPNATQVSVSGNVGSGVGTNLTEAPEATGEDQGETVTRRVTRGGGTGESGPTEAGGATGPGGSTGPGGPGGGPGGPGVQATYDCDKRQNAGASDIGVTAQEIRFAATVVKTGIAKDFLAEAQLGIEAAIQAKNAKGGVCGRLIKVDYEDDGWNSGHGTQIIKKWIGGKRHFGLLVNPSSEGLRGALDGKHIANAGFPVVGADGMLVGQYLDDWVWPVATSTYSVMHIMAKHAVQTLRAKNVAIVAETNYRFGYEGRIAFIAELKRLCKCEPAADIEVQGGQLSYKNKVNEFLGVCKSDFSGCDFVALLLEPATASQWVKDNGLGSGERHGSFKGVGAPQPLFVDSFIRDCRRPCADLTVWTSFKPPIYPFDREPAVARYVGDLKAISTSADASNPHVQGAYVGALLVIDALERLGPAPTRESLRQLLDKTTFDSELAPPFTFEPGNHFAAISAQAFRAVFNGNSFNNWQHEVDFITDTSVRADLGKL